MGRPALAATRAIEVLTLLEARPTQSLTLSEICTTLDLSLSSGHALMKVLLQSGYVSRHPVHKVYELGPALVALGHAALEHQPAIDLARDEVRHLADKLHIEVIAAAPIDQEIIVLARAGRPRHFEFLPRIGQRLPHVAPIGSIFVAWGPDQQIGKWLGHLPDDPAVREKVGVLLSRVRERGYEVGLETPTRDKIGHLLANLAGAPSSNESKEVLVDLIEKLFDETCVAIDLDDDEQYDPNYCMAPVFGPNGEIALGLTLLGLPAGSTGMSLRSYGEELLQSTRLITLSIGGRYPD